MEGPTWACQVLLKSMAGKTVAGSNPVPSATKKYGDEDFEVTVGSCENDRAILAPVIDGTDMMYSVIDVLKCVKENEFTVVDEYKGFVY